LTVTPAGQATPHARRAVLASMAALAGCVVLAALRSVPGPTGIVLAAVLLAPLLLPLRGLLRGNRRTFAWATLCVTPYFIYGTTELIANPRVRAPAAAILVASLALFLSLVACLRLTRPTPGGGQSP
jgi:uncharacterized membrane protein